MDASEISNSLAHTIGLCKIAIVVDRLCEEMKANPQIVHPFQITGDWGENRARITYFWWVALGGTPVERLKVDVDLRHDKPGKDAEELREWVELFRRAADTVVKPELAEAWMLNVLHMGHAIEVKDAELAGRN